MTFLRCVVLLAAVVLAVLAPIFIGHGLAAHGVTPFIIAGGLIIIAAGLMFALRSMATRREVVTSE